MDYTKHRTFDTKTSFKERELEDFSTSFTKLLAMKAG